VTTTYSLRVVCDERLSPECVGEHVETLTDLREIDYAHGRLWEAGWVRGYRGRDFIENASHDACPACAALLLRPQPHERQP
jgi:hypothetical protein